jgi:hypothetical protein
VGFSRLHHLRFVKREPMLTGILRVAELPPQSTFWRFLASLHLGVARQLLTVQWRMPERVWAAARASGLEKLEPPRSSRDLRETVPKGRRGARADPAAARSRLDPGHGAVPGHRTGPGPCGERCDRPRPDVICSGGVRPTFSSHRTTHK